MFTLFRRVLSFLTAAIDCFHCLCQMFDVFISFRAVRSDRSRRFSNICWHEYACILVQYTCTYIYIYTYCICVYSYIANAARDLVVRRYPTNIINCTRMLNSICESTAKHFYSDAIRPITVKCERISDRLVINDASVLNFSLNGHIDHRNYACVV